MIDQKADEGGRVRDEKAGDVDECKEVSETPKSNLNIALILDPGRDV